MKRLLLIFFTLVSVLMLRAQHLETSIKVVGGKVRIAVKAVGGDITGQPANFTFILAIPKTNEAAIPGTLTKLESSPQHVPLNLDPASGTSFADDDYKYFWYSYIDLASSVTFSNGIEYDILEFGQWSGPPQSAQVSLVSLPDGTSIPPTPPPPLDGLWNHYWQIGGIQYSDPIPPNGLFYQSGTSGLPVNGASYSELSIVTTTPLVTLPATLTSFSGYKNGSKNSLQWTTASESNNLGFDVQRSTDGTNYTSIGFVNSKAPGGSSSTSIGYTFDDNNPAGKKQYYRLQQQDYDGRTKLSNIVVISGDKPQTLAISGVFPNPTRNLVNILVDAPGKDEVTLLVIDITGKTVKQKIVNVETGSNTVPIEIGNFAQGSYVVKAICKSADCEMATGKFNKQ